MPVRVFSGALLGVEARCMEADRKGALEAGRKSEGNFSKVKSQEHTKWALEVAAAGGHGRRMCHDSQYL